MATLIKLSDFDQFFNLVGDVLEVYPDKKGVYQLFKTNYKTDQIESIHIYHQSVNKVRVTIKIYDNNTDFREDFIKNAPDPKRIEKILRARNLDLTPSEKEALYSDDRKVNTDSTFEGELIGRSFMKEDHFRSLYHLYRTDAGQLLLTRLFYCIDCYDFQLLKIDQVNKELYLVEFFEHDDEIELFDSEEQYEQFKRDQIIA